MSSPNEPSAQPGQVTAWRFREPTLRIITLWVAGAITGLVAVGYARVFVLLEQWFMMSSTQAPLLVILGSPLAFFLSWALVSASAPEAAGSGVPQLMAATNPSASAALREKLLSARAAVVRILGSCVAVAGGASIDREGPTMHVAGTIFRWVQTRLPAAWPRASMPSMLLAAGAAGLAAAFNTPLGGIVYAIEQLGRMQAGSFRTGVLHAVLVAGIVVQTLLGPYLYLGYPAIEPWTNGDLPRAALVGAIIGLIGAFWARALFRVVAWRSLLTTKRSRGAIALSAGMCFSALALLMGPATLGSGRVVIESLLFGDPTAGGLRLVLGRVFGSFISAGYGGPGGIFAPALASGGALASLLAPVFSPIEPRLFILLGMVAFLTGVTRTPLTAFVLVLEMTDRHTALLPMMLAALGAHFAANIVGRESLYERIEATIIADKEGEAAPTNGTSREIDRG